MKRALLAFGTLAALFAYAEDRVNAESNRVENVEVVSNGGEAESNKVEKVEKKDAAKKRATRPARITADTTVYNRKEGIASFLGHVHVDDEQYQMHADRVFLFLETNDVHRVKGGTNEVNRMKGGDTNRPDGNDATNGVRRAKKDKSKDSSGSGLGSSEVRRIVAIGNVAMTNEMRRAYGAKATYSKKQGLVVLYSGDGITAEVRDESKAQPQIVRGKRIRFWIGTEQVEVDEADLTGPAPSGGAESLKKALGR